MKEEKTVYYENELADDFSGVQRKTVTVGPDYPFRPATRRARLLSFLVWRVLMRPVAFLYCRFAFSLRIYHKKALRPFRRKGYFVYGNHTLLVGDAFIPNLLDYHKKTYVVVHPDNVSPGGPAFIAKNCGGIPIPNVFRALPAFSKTLQDILQEGHAVYVYPEAHVWPYATKIRNFPDTAFAYPVENQVPAFAATVTYAQKRGRLRVSVYIDGPFYPDAATPPRIARRDLRNRVYTAMCARAVEHNTTTPIRYIQKERME